jgi:hypothetical protein
MTALRAGVATVDLTPHDFPRIRLGGFGFNRRATGVLHPLEAGVLYLRDDIAGEEVALVTVDSVGLGRPWVQEIRRRVNRLADPSRILVCATHCHAAPDTMGYWGPSLLMLLPIRSGVEPGYRELLLSRVAAAVDRAVAAAVPARLRGTAFDVAPGLFTNHRAGGALDDHGQVLCVDRADDGRPLATLLNFAGHPEGLWDRNTRVSADYVHHVRAALGEAGVGVPLFFSGALGGMLTPNIPKDAPTAAREVEIARIGRALGETAAKAAVAAPAFESGGPLQIAHHDFRLPVQNWRFRLLRRLGVLERDIGEEVETEMNLVSVGGLRLLTVPGEALPELGAELRAALGSPLTMLACLGCDELGYILPPEKFDHPEWKYEVTMSVGRETAPRLLDVTRDLLAGLRGRS